MCRDMMLRAHSWSAKMPRGAATGDRHGRRPGHSERGDVAPLDGDLPRAVERPAGGDLVAREAAPSAARRYPRCARCTVGLGLCGGVRPLRDLGQRPGERHRRGRRRRADRRDRLLLRRAPHRDHHRGARFDRARARPRIIRRRRPRGAGDLSDAAAGARPQARQRQRRQRAARRRRAHHRGDRRRRPADPAGLLRPPRPAWSDAAAKAACSRAIISNAISPAAPPTTRRCPIGSTPSSTNTS